MHCVVDAVSRHEKRPVNFPPPPAQSLMESEAGKDGIPGLIDFEAFGNVVSRLAGSDVAPAEVSPVLRLFAPHRTM